MKWAHEAVEMLERIEAGADCTLHCVPGHGQDTISGEWMGLAVNRNAGTTAPLLVLIRPKGWTRTMVIYLDDIGDIVTSRVYMPDYLRVARSA